MTTPSTTMQAEQPLPLHQIYAMCLVEIEQMATQGLPLRPRQISAMNSATAAMSVIDPHAAADLARAFRRKPEIIAKAASGDIEPALLAAGFETRRRREQERLARLRRGQTQPSILAPDNVPHKADAAPAAVTPTQLDQATGSNEGTSAALGGAKDDPTAKAERDRRAQQLAAIARRGVGIG